MQVSLYAAMAEAAPGQARPRGGQSLRAWCQGVAAHRSLPWPTQGKDGKAWRAWFDAARDSSSYTAQSGEPLRIQQEFADTVEMVRGLLLPSLDISDALEGQRDWLPDPKTLQQYRNNVTPPKLRSEDQRLTRTARKHDSAAPKITVNVDRHRAQRADAMEKLRANNPAPASLWPPSSAEEISSSEEPAPGATLGGRLWADAADPISQSQSPARAPPAQRRRTMSNARVSFWRPTYFKR